MKTPAAQSLLRINNPNTKQFLEMWKEYQPFIIENVAKHWNACNKWSNDYLIKHCGNKVISICFFQQNFLQDYKKFAYDSDSYYKKEMQYKEYIKNIEDRTKKKR